MEYRTSQRSVRESDTLPGFLKGRMITQAIGLGLATALTVFAGPPAVDGIQDLVAQHEQNVLVSDAYSIGAAVLESALLSDDGDYPDSLTVASGRIAELPSLRLGTVGRHITYSTEGSRIKVQVCKDDKTACALFDSEAKSIAVFEDGMWQAL